MSGSRISEADELLYIYVSLRKLRCLGAGPSRNQKNQVKLDANLFPNTFLLKQLDERLENLDISADEICNDLFKQVCGRPREAGLSAQEKQKAFDLQSDATARYPEFDEYFHFCLVELYDFMISIDWHELDIRNLSKSDSDYVSKNLKFVSSFFAFQDALVDLVKKEGSRRSPVKASLKTIESPSDTAKPDIVVTKKSNLRDELNEKESPRARRRVRFKDLSPDDNDGSSDGRLDQGKRSSFRDNHSVFALDLLIFAINVYIQRLADKLITWSTEVQTDLDRAIVSIFDSKTKIRSKQLQVIAKRIKIHNDVHLTVLDQLSDIKRTYMLRTIYGTLLSRDSRKLLTAYKEPRIKVYLRRIGLDVEVKILLRLTRQCLQIFFNLIVCEINTDPIESPGKATNKNKENVTNFVLNWLKVDHVLFGQSEPKVQRDSSRGQLDEQRAELPTSQTKRPQLVAKTSTLSLNDRYRSSSRILSQVDNLGEFMREFIDMISDRLREEQQLKYFLEVIATGLAQMFQVIAPQLEQQLSDVKANEAFSRPAASKGLNLKVDTTRFQQDGNQEAATMTNTNLSPDMLAVKLRCLKFIHIISLANKIVSSEASNKRIEFDCDLGLDVRLAQFTRVCMETK